MNPWIKFAMQALAMVPAVVQGVEAIAAGAKAGAEKKDLAMASLGLASVVASQVVPAEHKPAAEAAAKLVSSGIDGFVALMNAIQHPDFAKAK